jgi:hypothetical protein
MFSSQPSLAELKLKALNYEREYKERQARREEQGQGQAMFSSQPYKKNQFNTKGKASMSSNKPKPSVMNNDKAKDVVCYLCKKKGHFMKECQLYDANYKKKTKGARQHKTSNC